MAASSRPALGRMLLQLCLSFFKKLTEEANSITITITTRRQYVKHKDEVTVNVGLYALLAEATEQNF